MTLNVGKEAAALSRMTVGELRERYAELFTETTQARNRTWLMALAIRGEKLIRDGVVADQSELARFGQITTARMTQIMLLLNLAPDLQEQILFLPRTKRGRDAVKETDVRRIATTLDWRKQRRMWAALQQRLRGGEAGSR